MNRIKDPFTKYVARTLTSTTITTVSIALFYSYIYIGFTALIVLEASALAIYAAFDNPGGYSE